MADLISTDYVRRVSPKLVIGKTHWRNSGFALLQNLRETSSAEGYHAMLTNDTRIVPLASRIAPLNILGATKNFDTLASGHDHASLPLVISSFKLRCTLKWVAAIRCVGCISVLEGL